MSLNSHKLQRSAADIFSIRVPNGIQMVKCTKCNGGFSMKSHKTITTKYGIIERVPIYKCIRCQTEWSF